VAITVDPFTDVETFAGELTLAPSAGEVIATSAPDVEVEDDEGLPAEVPGELLPVVLLPEVELEPAAPDPGLLLPVALELPTDALADTAEPL
jgi:hypothetical protein